MHALHFLAYLDPGTGSMVLQVVVGGLLGSLLAIKLAWKRIAGRFGRKPTDKADSEPPAADADTPDERAE